MAKNNAATAPVQNDALENEFGAFDGAENQTKVKPSVKGNIPKVGSYIVEVLKVHLEPSYKGHNMFVANLFIHSSNNKERPAGSRMDYIMPINAPWKETKLGNIRGFLAAGYGIDWKEVDAKKSAEACRSTQPLKGKYLSMEVSEGTKKDGSPLTICAFEPNETFKPRSATAGAVAAAAAEAENVDLGGAEDEMPF
jgi:hypothetical protein